MMLAYTTYIAFGGGILGLPLIHSFLWPFVCFLLSRHRVPVTGRRQILDRDAEHILIERNRKTKWYLNFVSRPRLEINNPLTEAVQAVLDKLSTAEVARGNDFKLVVCHDIAKNKFTATALPDGTIFISTSQLSGCFKIGHVGAILAHEMGHLIARHTAERFSLDLVSNKFAELLGLDGIMYNNLVAIRLQELEADHIGLTLMSDTGFDPQDFIDYLEGQIIGSWNSLKEKPPVSEALEDGLNGHPSMKERIVALSPIMLKARALFEQCDASKPNSHSEWMAIRQKLEREAFEGSHEICTPEPHQNVK